MTPVHDTDDFLGVARRLPPPAGAGNVPAATNLGKVMTVERKPYRRSAGPLAGRVLSGVVAAAMLAAAMSAFGGGAADAEGALAVGIARAGIAKGYATGFSINQPTVKAARTAAVEQCKRARTSNADARSNCEVVTTFRNKCVAVALDPQPGTPGAGWGIGSDQEAADSLALARCHAKAGSDRAGSCEVTDRYCDGQ